MKVPIINHPDYVAQIGDDHRFPIKKFGELIKLLKKDGIANEQNIFEPKGGIFRYPSQSTQSVLC